MKKKCYLNKGGINLHFIIIFLIVFGAILTYEVASNEYRMGFDAGVIHVKTPYIFMSYYERGYGCNATMPFGEHDVEITNTQNPTHVQWYVNFKPSEWNCTMNSYIRFEDKSVCLCGFIGG